MGCSLDKPSTSQSLDGVADLCNNSKKALNLSEHQKKLIKKTWAYLEADMGNLGIRIFLRIFDQNPGVKQLFPFRDSWGDALIKDPMFKAHGHRFMVVIKQAVERMDDPEKSYAQILVRLGAWHSFNKEFCVCNMSLFTDSVLFVWRQRLKEKLTDEGTQAWRVLFNYISEKLQEGFDASHCPHM